MPKRRGQRTPAARPKRNSEFRAYGWIVESLKALGWNTRSPNRDDAGQVYTQIECRDDAEIHARLGQEVPENVVKVRENTYWIVEAKSRHTELQAALEEARQYAKKINSSRQIVARFVSGVAGNEQDTFLVATEYWDGKRFKPVKLNDKEVTGFMSPEIVMGILDTGNPEVKEVQIDEALFLAKAEKINETLHDGGINLKLRAEVMSALLLSRLDETRPNVDSTPAVLIQEINARSKQILTAQGKQSYHPYVELKLPATVDNHTKFKAAIVKTIQELDSLNIRSAMNSGTDVLGKFYEVFLKYGNGAREIGIVLTPRHITTFAAEVLGITAKDVVYDPCCGTGGFLVAALDHVKRTSRKLDVDSFKENNIYGVDQDTPVVTLAIVNMIFRGDGKNNIVEGNCFHKHVVKQKNGKVDFSNVPAQSDDGKVISKVLMNPPFPTSGGQDKEYEFVDTALAQMQDNGLLFSVLPYPTLVKSGAHKAWRKEKLLRNNTLLCVVTFPPDLFYPTGTHTAGIFVRKGVPHPRGQNVLWVRAVHDGLLKSKGKRLPSQRETNDYPVIKNLVSSFLRDESISVTGKEMFYKACPIDFADPNFELAPEYYLDQAAPTAEEIQQGVENVIRNAVAFLVREGLDDAD
ncbi:MAG TPA: N-6 DNA methylase [Candidatus Thermoplasmatota archaeon]|nr:N-6 DNA methylase [Candidatus Thermoplasmatota archaeon]